MSLSDPVLIGDAVSAAVGFVGALVGGTLGYLAAMRQHRVEHEFKKGNVLGAVLIELCRNQSGLARSLDRAMPAWLARLHLGTPAQVATVKDILTEAGSFRMQVYEHLMPDLLTSEFASELMSYYDRIASLNRVPNGTLDPADFHNYAYDLSGALIRADDLVLELLKTRKRSLRPTWGKNRDVDAFLESRERYRFLAELSLHKLKKLKAYLDGSEDAGPLPEMITRNREWVQAYVRAAEKL